MKNLNRNFFILAAAICFSVFGFIGEKTTAQTKTAAKSTSTPKAKKSPTTAAKSSSKTSTDSKTAKTSSVQKIASKNSASTKQSAKVPTDTKSSKDTKKTVAKETSKTTAKTSNSSQAKTDEQKPQIIVSVTSARVRSEPNLNASTLRYAKIGTIFPVLDKNESWSQIQLSDGESGWISKTIISDFAAASRENIYRQIADKYLQRKSLDFTTASQVFEFLNRAEKETKAADLSFKRLLALRAALQAIPIEKMQENPYKNFTENYKNEIVYSEPSAQWHVRSDIFWQLHNANKDKPLGEEIAWQAAQNPIPGECEGYINCYLYLLRVTEGEYLNFYPNGKYSRQAVKNIGDLLEPIAADAKIKQVYYAATDITDRAEFNRTLAELRTIISKLPFIEKQKALQQINSIAEGFR
ncbi:MAG TPA: SH3 domain-containing protein [Pyrinomonadaceae bacterium]|nr:SH3 domain-containing protein [Pyrinomonadaceae bacterium]